MVIYWVQKVVASSHDAMSHEQKVNHWFFSEPVYRLLPAFAVAYHDVTL